MFCSGKMGPHHLITTGDWYLYQWSYEASQNPNHHDLKTSIIFANSKTKFFFLNGERKNSFARICEMQSNNDDDNDDEEYIPDDR